jgi:hypothetical protein
VSNQIPVTNAQQLPSGSEPVTIPPEPYSWGP